MKCKCRNRECLKVFDSHEEILKHWENDGCVSHGFEEIEE